MNEKWPFNSQVIRTPGNLGPGAINPMPSVPGEQFGRTIDPPSTASAGAGAGAEPVQYPFDILIDSSFNATVRPGTINGLMPSNNSSVTAFAPATGALFLVIHPVSSGGIITGSTLSFEASAPTTSIPVTLGAPPTAFDYLLGIVTDRVIYRTIGTGSLTATSTEVFRVTKVSPSPGTLPYEIYYTWSIYNA